MKYNKQIKKGIKDIENIKLSFDENDNIFSHVDLYIKENPLKVDSPRVITFGNFLARFKEYKYYHSMAFVIVFLFAGFGAIDASEEALPGDVLYPVKTKIVEPIVSVIKVTEKAKVEYKEDKVIKRLEEVGELAKKGEFKNEKRIQAEKEVDNSVKAIVAVKKKNKTKATTTNKNISTEDYDTNFKNKINTRLDEIKKVDISVDKTDIVKFEEKVKNNLKDVFDNGIDNKINLGL
jgi:hypothetical protein